MRIAHGDIQITVCVPPVTERSAGEPRQATRMTIRERDYETIRRCIRKPMNTVRREIVILPLFAVCDNRRACGFKPLNGISNRIFIERSKIRILTVAFCDSVDELNGSRDAAYWLGRYGNGCRLGHTQAFSRTIDLPLV